MKKQITFVLAAILALVSAAGVSAQGTAGAGSQVRVFQFFYQSMDVLVDGQPAVQKIGFTFDTDYLPLAAGKHTFAVASSSKGAETGTSTDLDLVDGHQYSVMVYGNWESDPQPTFLVLDETEKFAGMDSANDRILFLHLVSGGPAVDGYVNDQLVQAGLSYGQAVAFEVPPGPFKTKITLAGNAGAVLQEFDSFYGIPQAVTVAALIGASPLNFFLNTQTTTALNMADYLDFESKSMNGYQLAAMLIKQTGLTSDLAGAGPFTLFLPTDDAINALPQAAANALLSDPAKLAEVVRYHVVPAYLPPYLLEGQTSLKTLQGSTLTLDFSSGDWWHVNGVPIYPAVRVGNGVVHPIFGVLDPVSGAFQPGATPTPAS